MGGKTRPPPTTTGPCTEAAQQRLLDVFARVFGSALASDDFPAVLRDIKQALFRRDFATAFASEKCLDAYAARWSPTRALCYAHVLSAVAGHIRPVLAAAAEVPGADEGPDTTEQQQDPRPLRMLSVGGCAAEHVAFAQHLHVTASRGALTLLDAAPWANVTSRLQRDLTLSPPLSKYASASAVASNQPLVLDSQLSTTFVRADILSLTQARIAELVGSDAMLVTLLFTLNELYTEGGLVKTTAFLRTLSGALASHSFLLVVDSPGSYSEAAVGKEKKRYPMHWLLDHTLLRAATQDYHWEKLESHDSLWFRLPEALSYPIQLENMRYQMHLYRIHKS